MRPPTCGYGLRQAESLKQWAVLCRMCCQDRWHSGQPAAVVETPPATVGYEFHASEPSKMPGLVPLFPSCAGVHSSDLLKSRTAHGRGRISPLILPGCTAERYGRGLKLFKAKYT